MDGQRMDQWMGTLKLRDMKLRDMESAGKAEYGKPLTDKYWDFAHVNTTCIPSE